MTRKDRLDLMVFLSIFVLILCTSAMIFTSNIRSVSFDRDNYYSHYDEMDTESSFDEDVDLEYETELLLNYLERGEREQDLMSNMFYSERERTHLGEVRTLYRTLILIQNITLWISAFALIVLIIGLKRYLPLIKRDEINDFLRVRLGILLTGTGMIVFFLSLIMIIFALGFSISFHYFHVFLFPTDTWMLSADDSLIRMFPQQFFFDMFLKIILHGLIFGAALLTLGFLAKHSHRLIEKFR